jgi:hypothetical protein
VIALCRKLAGHDPAARLEVYRGTTLALTVRSIGEGSRLVIIGKETVSDGPLRWLQPRW